jgi:predicted phosphodiesterase
MRAFEKIGGRLEGDFLEVDLEIGRLAVYHGTVPAIRDALAGRGCYRLLVCGHTHRVEDRAEGATRILNPGSAHGFGKEPTVMIYDSVTDAAHLIRLHEPQPGCVL